MNVVIPLAEPLTPELLDTALAVGFYRMRQSLFTVDAIAPDSGKAVPVFWARVTLKDYQPSHRYLKLLRRCRRFDCSLEPARIDDEIEKLYARYLEHISFEAGPDVQSALLGPHTEDFFPGRMWQVRDRGQLIAVGYFDEGTTSAAGILNFYDPDYKGFSLGTWLYLKNVDYAASLSREFFYPGYIALGYTKFDYKLYAGIENIELWDPIGGQWIPYEGSLHHRHRGSREQ
jgi:arginine-tRNA-protein transferase